MMSNQFRMIKVSEHGTSNVYIARLWIQMDDIIKFMIPYTHEKQKYYDFIEAMQKIAKAMIYCEEKNKKFIKHIEEQALGINKESFQFSEIIELEEDVEAIFYKFKNVLRDFSQCLRKTFPSSEKYLEGKAIDFYSSEEETRDANIIKWLRQEIQIEEKDLEIFKKEEYPWIRMVSKMRNRIEHGEKKKRVKIRNITITNDNKITVPTWSLGECGDEHNLIDDVATICINLLTFIEDMICFIYNKEGPPCTRIIRIREEDTNPQCPKVLRVYPTKELEEKIRKK